MLYYGMEEIKGKEEKPETLIVRILHVIIYAILITAIIGVLYLGARQAIKTQRKDAAFINKHVVPVVDAELKTFKSNQSIKRILIEKQKLELELITVDQYNHRKDSLAKFIE